MYNKFKDVLESGSRTQLSERQITKRSTHQSVEEIYTLDDQINKNTNDYQFEYPYRWLTDESQDKKIGIRRLECTPSSHAFEIGVSCFDHNGNAVGLTTFARMDITDRDDIVEIMHLFCQTFQPYVNNQPTGTFKFYFNSNVNSLVIWYEDSTNQWGSFQVRGRALLANYVSLTDWIAHENGLMEFFKMFNINMNDENFKNYDPNVHDLPNAPAQQNQQNELLNVVNGMRDKDLYPDVWKAFTKLCIANRGIVTLNNVWDRKRLYFHSTFSTSHRQLIGKNKDFYPSLSVWYPAPSNESAFNVSLSTDGRQKIYLHNCNIDLQLCYSYH